MKINTTPSAEAEMRRLLSPRAFDLWLHPDKRKHRNDLLAEMLAAGMSVRDCADHFGITRERVYQIRRKQQQAQRELWA